MTLQPIANPAYLIPENFLASTAELVAVLAHLAGSSNVHSSRRRRDQRLVDGAISKLVGNIQTAQRPTAGRVAQVKASVPARLIAAAPAARISGRRIGVEANNGPYSPQQRQRCNCGQCPACLGNARWDRIYAEKFADPAYYAGIVIRHNSALAETL